MELILSLPGRKIPLENAGLGSDIILREKVPADLIKLRSKKKRNGFDNTRFRWMYDHPETALPLHGM